MINLDRISKNISREIEDDLIRAGLFYRIFNRIKTESSILKKIKEKGYNTTIKKLQDSIGIRIVFYFNDDTEIFLKFIKSKFELVDPTVDKPEIDKFSADRKNLVFKIPDSYLDEFIEITKDIPEIDHTFEVQLRTLLSEGWHEVEHDLRYKCKEDWENHEDLGRILNGIYATLVTSDWSMLHIFEEMAHRFYKSQNIIPMLRSKLRLRLDKTELEPHIINIIKGDNDLFKELYRADRNTIVSYLLTKKINIPLNYNNIVYLLNFLTLKNNDITKSTPSPILAELS